MELNAKSKVSKKSFRMGTGVSFSTKSEMKLKQTLVSKCRFIQSPETMVGQRLCLVTWRIPKHQWGTILT